jgi:soluble lytic murein transglycosylase-like protein
MRKILKLFLPIIMALSITFTSTAQPAGTYISEDAQEACVKYGEEYGICPELLMAMIERESSGRPDAESGGCKGLMQISDRWHKDRMERLEVTDIYDVDGNIHVGADYLTELFEKYEDVGIVLMVYHGEKNAATKTELSDYADWILTRSAELERMNGK